MNATQKNEQIEEVNLMNIFEVEELEGRFENVWSAYTENIHDCQGGTDVYGLTCTITFK